MDEENTKRGIKIGINGIKAIAQKAKKIIDFELILIPFSSIISVITIDRFLIKAFRQERAFTMSVAGMCACRHACFGKFNLGFQSH
jgi:hypothetical protein